MSIHRDDKEQNHDKDDEDRTEPQSAPFEPTEDDSSSLGDTDQHSSEDA